MLSRYHLKKMVVAQVKRRSSIFSLPFGVCFNNRFLTIFPLALCSFLVCGKACIFLCDYYKPRW